MAYYRRSGEVPPKRHTQHRRPDGGLYYEELMGEEGFSSDSSLLYHRGIPSAHRRRRAVGAAGDLATTPNHPLVPRHLKLHELFGDDWKAVDAGHRAAAGARQRRRADLLRGGRRDQPALPQRDRRRVRLRRVRRGHRGDRLRRAGRPRRATTCCCRAPPRTAGCPSGGEPLRAYVHRGQLAHRAAQALPVPLRAAAGARPVLRARPARPGRAAAGRRRRTSRCWSSTAGRAAGSPAPGTCTRPTRSTWSAGTAACTRTRSTSPTSSRSPAGCTSRRRCTRCSRATTS